MDDGALTHSLMSVLIAVELYYMCVCGGRGTEGLVQKFYCRVPLEVSASLIVCSVQDFAIGARGTFWISYVNF